MKWRIIFVDSESFLCDHKIVFFQLEHKSGNEKLFFILNCVSRSVCDKLCSFKNSWFIVYCVHNQPHDFCSFFLLSTMKKKRIVKQRRSHSLGWCSIPPPQLRKNTWDRYGTRTHVQAVIVWGSDWVSWKSFFVSRRLSPDFHFFNKKNVLINCEKKGFAWWSGNKMLILSTCKHKKILISVVCHNSFASLISTRFQLHIYKLQTLAN